IDRRDVSDPVARITARGEVQKVPAVGKEMRKTVRLFLLRFVQLGRWTQLAAARWDTEQRASAGGVGGQQDHAVAPRAEVVRARRQTRQHLGWSTGGCDFLELSLREKTNVLAVGRPEHSVVLAQISARKKRRGSAD